MTGGAPVQRGQAPAGERPAGAAPVYRAAIIGTGRIASSLERDPLRSKPHTHAGWYRHHPRTTLVAGADVDPAALSAFAEDWHIPRDGLFADYREMLDRVRPDIVSICAWAPERLAMARDALAAGAKGLWIEKALACSAREAREMERLVAEAGAAAIVDHPRRADGAYRGVKRLIETQGMGRLESVHCLMSGMVIHTGTHAWDMLHYWCGAPARVTGWLDGDVATSGPVHDTGGHGCLEYPGGARAWITAREKQYFVFQFDLVFSEGRVQIGNDVMRVLRPAPSPRYSGFCELSERAEPLDDPYPHPMVCDLVRAMDTGLPPLMSIANAAVALRTGLALVQSHREGHRPIALTELDEDLTVISR